MKTKTTWAWVAGTFFGIGFLGPGPGTWASLAAALLWFWGAHAAHLSAGGLAAATAVVACMVTAIGIPAGTRVAQETGRDDPGHVVLDEVAGQWVALIACPVHAAHVILAFLLFRIFDIVKPWPARQLEQLHGGTGIMLDDIAAGGYALLIMLAVQHWWH
jgi:phosphatidylglycerophosphatase A